MEQLNLPEKIESYDNWKSEISKALKSYRLWMRRNQLFTNEADIAIYRMLETLSQDHLTIAFTGEFSRGKTELINAIFFAEYGVRVLPSQAGRTTMCPTELLYDASSEAPYLRLLPIETRFQDISIAEYKKSEKHWVEVKLPIDDADAVIKAVSNITDTKEVPLSDALALGFDEKLLTRNMNREQMVSIPVWRHAVMSFPHPLLKRGLCILDTPGLNALGNEPELTINMLPNAQAVVFILAADTGVTASDMTIWEEHVKQLDKRSNIGLYAVLNKIDTLWDDLSDKASIERNLDAVRSETARHLSLEKSAIIPVSAQKGLLAKIKQNADLLDKSRINELETLLATSILDNKQSLLWETLVKEASELIKDNCIILQNRKQQIMNQKYELDTLRNVSAEQIKSLIEKSETARNDLNKTLMTLKPSQRLMEKQMGILLNTICQDKVENHILYAKKELIKSKTTIGLLKSMKHFFANLETIMIEFCHEAELSNKMADSIYRKFQEEHQLELLEPRLLPAKKYRRRMEAIFLDAEQFNRTFITTLTEQSIAIRRFFSTTVAKILAFFADLRKDCTQWSGSIMNPLMHQIRGHKEFLERYLNDLSTMQSSTATVRGRLKALDALVDELNREIEHANRLVTLIEAPRYEAITENVVSLAHRRR